MSLIFHLESFCLIGAALLNAILPGGADGPLVARAESPFVCLFLPEGYLYEDVVDRSHFRRPSCSATVSSGEPGAGASQVEISWHPSLEEAQRFFHLPSDGTSLEGLGDLSLAEPAHPDGYKLTFSRGRYQARIVRGADAGAPEQAADFCQTLAQAIDQRLLAGLPTPAPDPTPVGRRLEGPPLLAR
jgi:hypothetical protein